MKGPGSGQPVTVSLIPVNVPLLTERELEYVTECDVHRVTARVVDSSEVLLVRRGRCEVDIYNGEKQFVATRELQEGDLLIVVAGGHGFRMLEDTV